MTKNMKVLSLLLLGVILVTGVNSLRALKKSQSNRQIYGGGAPLGIGYGGGLGGSYIDSGYASQVSEASSVGSTTAIIGGGYPGVGYGGYPGGGYGGYPGGGYGGYPGGGYPGGGYGGYPGGGYGGYPGGGYGGYPGGGYGGCQQGAVGGYPGTVGGYSGTVGGYPGVGIVGIGGYPITGISGGPGVGATPTGCATTSAAPNDSEVVNNAPEMVVVPADDSTSTETTPSSTEETTPSSTEESTPVGANCTNSTTAATPDSNN